ncbi:lytic murein transglycosylase B [Noviherbaspirillum galbum]|uniref:Lytic murein transglycosylase B n=1 Tax=Noviherbaspirillum galbum TaxID=2709383 RepID=A0A6B3SIF1_9BURK|nr:lytic murein transglycosylase B [Noviherbaspirillum galbum]NEX60601.1 lytic murein transglycosylase B [Noviherbaspirillum galbum]
MSITFLHQAARGVAVSLALLSLSASIATAGNAEPKSRSASKAAKGNLRKVALSPDEQGEFANFSQWKNVADFIDEMVEKHGFDRAALEATFKKTRYIDSAVQLVKPAPPGKPKNWRAYRSRFVEPIRINAGVAFWDKYADALARAEQTYGVPAEIIVGIIGVETIYGRNTGNFRVLDALTTLAFDYPDTPNRDARMSFFRGEVENTLLFAREANLDPFSLLGSYAGAIGWPQFMPGSIRKFAVDFDGDGRVDLRGSPVDAIGSVANFLVQHGWKSGEPVAFPVTVARDETMRAWDMFIGQGLEAKFSLDELKGAGIVPTIEPPADMRFGLVDLQNGGEPTEYWLGANNFFAITQYNRSFFYAMSVVDLGRAVRTARSR